MRKDERKQKFLPQGVQGNFLHILEELSNRREIRLILWGLEGMEGKSMWVETHWDQQKEFYGNYSCLCLYATLSYHRQGSPTEQLAKPEACFDCLLLRVIILLFFYH